MQSNSQEIIKKFGAKKKDQDFSAKTHNSKRTYIAVRFISTNGSVQSLDYSMILSRVLNPDEGTLVVNATDRVITIHGRNLLKLLDDLELRAIRLVEAKTEIEDDSPETDLFINKIEVKSRD